VRLSDELAPGAAGDAAAADPPPTLELTFALPGGGVVGKVFSARPLGMDVGKGSPLLAKRIFAGMSAEQLGVQAGWHIVAVNGKDLETTDYLDAWEVLMNASAVLPHSGGRRTRSADK